MSAPVDEPAYIRPNKSGDAIACEVCGTTISKREFTKGHPISLKGYRVMLYGEGLPIAVPSKMLTDIGRRVSQGKRAPLVLPGLTPPVFRAPGVAGLPVNPERPINLEAEFGQIPNLPLVCPRCKKPRILHDECWTAPISSDNA